MSTTNNLESGATAKETNTQSPTTAPPHDQQSPAPTTELPAQPDPVADTSIPSAQPLEQTAVNQTQLHPATGPGGESEPAPVTSPNTTTAPQTITDNAPSVVLAQTNTPPSMDTDEPKNTPETSTEHSDDGSGKEVEEDPGPSLAITLLLTTGSRHPFTIDGKYLRKRSVNVENFDPFLMSVYTLKELIWREWRSGKLDLDLPHGGGMNRAHLDMGCAMRPAELTLWQTGRPVPHHRAPSVLSRLESCWMISRLSLVRHYSARLL